MSTREELEATLDKLMSFDAMMKSMMETRNSMIKLDMAAGTPITVSPTTIGMLRDEFISKLRVELPDEAFSVYVDAMTNYAPKIVTTLEHIGEIIQAQTETENNVQM